MAPLFMTSVFEFLICSFSPAKEFYQISFSCVKALMARKINIQCARATRKTDAGPIQENSISLLVPLLIPRSHYSILSSAPNPRPSIKVYYILRRARLTLQSARYALKNTNLISLPFYPSLGRGLSSSPACFLFCYLHNVEEGFCVQQTRSGLCIRAGIIL